MNATIKHYQEDGADYQSKCVLAILQEQIKCSDILNGIEDARRRCAYDIMVSIWHNWRECGYILQAYNSSRSQSTILVFNIAWFTHRNSDEIVAIKWQGGTGFHPGINDVPEGVYKDKNDVAFSVTAGKYDNMARWIVQELEDYYKE